MEAEPVTSEFDLVAELGIGSYGAVFLIQHRKHKNLKLALKKIELSNCPVHEREEAMNEAHCLEDIHHDHVVQFVHSYLIDHTLFIVTDFCEAGDLQYFMSDLIDEHVPEALVLTWTAQVVDALEWMHKDYMKIIHRDLKPSNIYLTRKGDVKLGDLGLSTILDSSDEEVKKWVGTPYYMSPEVFTYTGYNEKTDIWSLGCIVYEMTARERAYDAPYLNFLLLKVINNDPPTIQDFYSEDLRELGRIMLEKDKTLRPSAEQLLKMDIVQQHLFRRPMSIIKNLKFETLKVSPRFMYRELTEDQLKFSPMFDVTTVQVPVQTVEESKSLEVGNDLKPRNEVYVFQGERVMPYLNWVSDIPQYSQLPSPVRRRSSHMDWHPPPPPPEKKKDKGELLKQMHDLQKQCAVGIGESTLLRTYKTMDEIHNPRELQTKLKGVLGEDKFSKYGNDIMQLRILELGIQTFDSGRSST